MRCVMMVSVEDNVRDATDRLNESVRERKAGIPTIMSRRCSKMFFFVVPADQGMVNHSSRAKNVGARVAMAMTACGKLSV